MALGWSTFYDLPGARDLPPSMLTAPIIHYELKDDTNSIRKYNYTSQ